MTPIYICKYFMGLFRALDGSLSLGHSCLSSSLQQFYEHFVPESADFEKR